MKLPDFIWILGVPVELTNEPTEEGDFGTFGSAGTGINHTHRMYVDTDVSDWLHTLWSEIIHTGLSILTDGHFDEIETVEEEWLTGSLSTVIHSVLLNNPWITEVYADN